MLDFPFNLFSLYSHEWGCSQTLWAISIVDFDLLFNFFFRSVSCSFAYYCLFWMCIYLRICSCQQRYSNAGKKKKLYVDVCKGKLINSLFIHRTCVREFGVWNQSISTGGRFVFVYLIYLFFLVVCCHRDVVCQWKLETIIIDNRVRFGSCKSRAIERERQKERERERYYYKYIQVRFS